MKASDLVLSAVSNTFRSKTRTTLTVLAIFVGSFTLTLTNGIGTGIGRFIDNTVSSIGASDVMTVTKAVQGSGRGPGATGPVKYEPGAIAAGDQGGPPGGSVIALTSADITALTATPGVLTAQPSRTVAADYVALGDGTKYVASIGVLVPGQKMQWAAGAAPDEASSSFEVAIPTSLVKPLGFATADDAVGATITIAVSDALKQQYEVQAKVTGVVEETLVGTGTSLAPNAALTDKLVALQGTGLDAKQLDKYASASVTFAANASSQDVTTLKQALKAQGYTGTTVADQLGTFRTVIDAIVLVLNGFAVIALLAAGFGIVNTLLMSVQERTREIGLMKAMGMASGKVFALFSVEAVVIGLLGSGLGTVIGMGVGTVISDALAAGMFADIPGLTLIAFDPVTILATTALVVGLALVAGAVPAARAARANPVESLRYE